ncbi:stage III sporulation protein AE [Velocimicrobium porci]|uniref:Stage III sporulation protein AF n=1 Tax=Velocimicrobium porci TaxID=2606634 RepID=A0A6L5XY73_9FIRM|nr:stage III sporulation protein AE [Velocimicrobium porci]MSS63745.1 stage III sporulation protein AF [Velocimicrobium porci]
MKQYIFFWLICMILSFIPVKLVCAEEITDYMDDIDYDTIQKSVDEILETDHFDVKEYVEKVVTGDSEVSFELLKQSVQTSLEHAFSGEKSIIIRLLAIAVIGAVFTNFSNVFKQNQVADVGFFVTYLLLFSVMTASFYIIAKLASTTLVNLLDFMKALVPSYFIAVTFSTGATTSIVFYQASLVLITIIETILVKVILPMINIYFVASLTNYIAKEDYLSKMVELIELVVSWTLKTMLGIVIGYNFIQGMIVPVADQFKKSTFMRAASVIPGVGNAIGGVTETVLGAGILVKNAVGTLGMILILCMIAAPIIKIAGYALLYKLGSAMVQPISDKRILECLNGASKGARLLLYTVFVGGVMLLLTIAIVMSSTNVGLS